jgi:hypothetical protein
MGVAWMVLGSASGEPPIDGGLALFSMFNPRADNLPFLGEVSVHPSPRGQEVEADSRNLSSSPGVRPRSCL